jgi:hypothetical protein
MVELECMYCGHKWEQTVYNKQTVENSWCPKCKDSNLKVRDLAAAKIDTYAGSPPFPPKPEKKGPPDWSFGMDFGNEDSTIVSMRQPASVEFIELKVDI